MKHLKYRYKINPKFETPIKSIWAQGVVLPQSYSFQILDHYAARERHSLNFFKISHILTGI